MNRTRALIAAGAIAVVVIGGTTGAAIVASDDDKPLTGSTLERASKDALDHTGGGTVVETEAGDDGTAYAVEIQLPNGRVVEVALDANFQVVAASGDEDSRGEGGGSDDDG